MIRKILPIAICAAVAAGSVHAAGFTNGGFEDGDLGGWNQGGGSWYGTPALPVPASNYAGGPSNNTLMTAGTDPISGANTVYNGNYSVRVNDRSNDYSVSTIDQSVTNYTDTDIYFQWNAVLEASHGLTDSDYFSLTLHDDTTGTDVLTRSYSSASAPGVFINLNNGWYSSGWQLEHIDLTTAGAGGTSLVGNDFTLTLLASDCPYGGHAGYTYLDGFAPIIVPPGAPEPGSLALLGLGLAGLAVSRRRNSAA